MNRKERDEIRAEVDAEFEAEERELKKGGNKKNKKRAPKESLVHEDELGSLFGDDITGKLPRYANKITMKVSPPRNVLLREFVIFGFYNSKVLLIVIDFRADRIYHPG